MDSLLNEAVQCILKTGPITKIYKKLIILTLTILTFFNVQNKVIKSYLCLN